MPMATTTETAFPEVQKEWYIICVDIDKSKFFDPNHAVLEGDIFWDVFVKAKKEIEIPGDKHNGDTIRQSHCQSSRDACPLTTNPGRLILKRGERCFVMVRKNTGLLFDTIVPSAFAKERKDLNRPRTTGWLRHEMYGLQAILRLPMEVATADGKEPKYLTQNKRGIKCLDLPGEFLGLWDPESTKDADILGSIDRIREVCEASPFSVDKDDILTIKQSDLQERLTRHKHFANWLIEKFGLKTLNRGSGVLDVAGGNGKLSAALRKMGIDSCTIVDPHPLCANREGVLIVKEALEGDGSHLTSDGHPYAERIRNASIVIGLHPDQATEAVVDMALRLGKPFAVSPCCTMTRLFPKRTHKGEPVRTVHSLCRYLLDKSVDPTTSPIRVDFLPFAGRNKVLYWKGFESSPIICQNVAPSSQDSANEN